MFYWSTVAVIALLIAFWAFVLSSTIYVLGTRPIGAVLFVLKTLFLGLITVPLAILLVVLTLSSMALSGVSRWKAKAELAPRDAIDVEGDVVVHLIHGTFEHNAAWTLPGSAMCRRIVEKNPMVKISRFVWSGSNTHRGRSDAVRALSKRLEDSPSVDHYIVAHSHGGNIARDLWKEYPGLREKIKGLCFLSTPFIHRQKIERTGKDFTFTHIFGFIVLSQAPLLAVLAALGMGSYFLLALIPSSVIALAVEVCVGKRTEESLAAELDADHDGVEMGNVTILHAIGDEADSILRFVSFLHEVCFGLFSQLNATAEKMRAEAERSEFRRYAPYIIGALMTTLVAIFLWAVDAKDIWTLAFLIASASLLLGCFKERKWPSSGDSNILIMAATPVGALSYWLCAIKSLAYGDWRLMFSPRIFVFSSETPQGSFPVIKYAPRTDGGLVHSTHSHPDAIEEVACWLGRI